MAKSVFKGDFTQQSALPEEAIRLANDVLLSAKLHRYNVTSGEESQAALLEKEYALYQQRTYCLALTSCGQALQIALRAIGVRANDHILTNAFTLAPVPGAIAGVGAQPIFIESTADLVIDVDDLDRKAAQYRGSIFMLSHMRGHICDMDAVMAIVKRHDLRLIEDCAHTMGAKWGEEKSGNFGRIGCFSAQTYKHINSGEGGFLVTDDEEIIAKSILMSGSYMLYTMHGTIANKEVFDAVQPQTPNLSARLDNLRAALLRPQVAELNARVNDWNERYQTIYQQLQKVEPIYLPKRFAKEHFVGSSLQFLLPSFSAADCRQLVKACDVRGVILKWFGAEEPAGFTSTYRNWQYAPKQQLKPTDTVLSTLFDIRIPLSFSLEDCALIASIIEEEILELKRR